MKLPTILVDTAADGVKTQVNNAAKMVNTAADGMKTQVNNAAKIVDTANTAVKTQVKVVATAVVGLERISAASHEPDEENQDTKLGEQHLISLKNLHVVKSAARFRKQITDEYNALNQSTKTAYSRWLHAMIHFRKRIKPKESSNQCWNGTLEFRERVLQFLEQPKVEIFVLFLVLSDLILVILEVMIDRLFEFPHHGDHDGGHGSSHGGGHESDHGSAVDEAHTSEQEEHEAHAADHEIHTAEHADDHNRRLRVVIRSMAKPVVRRWVYDGQRFLSEAGGAGSCDIESAEDIANVCRWISITILFVFASELIIKFTCAPVSFSKHIGHIIDVFVVGCSLLFEFTLHHSKIVGLLIFFRCWRGVRIVHGLYEQVEYICKALQTEAHLAKALHTVTKYKTYTTLRHLRSDWSTFKREGKEGLEHTRVIISASALAEQGMQTDEISTETAWKHKGNSSSDASTHLETVVSRNDKLMVEL